MIARAAHTPAFNAWVIGRSLFIGLVLSGVAFIGGAGVATPARAAVAEPDGYSASALYNLGNSYARDGKPGMAVLEYERASLLAPNDPDIEANLRFERRTARVPAEPPSLFTRIARIIDPTILAWSGLLGVALAGFALIAGQFPRLKSRAYALRSILFATGVILLSAAVCNAMMLWPLTQEAIVITNATPARVAPVPMGDVLFTLAEAETVRVRAAHEGFLLVRTGAGKTGWVSQTSIVPVVPTAARKLPDHAPP